MKRWPYLAIVALVSCSTAPDPGTALDRSSPPSFPTFLASAPEIDPELPLARIRTTPSGHVVEGQLILPCQGAEGVAQPIRRPEGGLFVWIQLSIPGVCRPAADAYRYEFELYPVEGREYPVMVMLTTRPWSSLGEGNHEVLLEETLRLGE
jgi:hypothetical protein